MKRRDFIKLSASTALLLALNPFGSLEAAQGSAATPKTIVNLVLDGGPDFRHLIVPAYESDNDDSNSYAYNFWKARGSLFGKYSPSDLKQVYSQNYDDITISGIKCGILKKCAWLKDEIGRGNVAIINNVVASTNRNHYHSLIMMENGSLSANEHNLDVSGWLGRSAKALGDANVVSLSREVRLVCNGPCATNPNTHDNSIVIANPNSRSMGLYDYDTQADLDSGSNNYQWSTKAKMSRALKSYYQAKATLIAPASIYRKPIEHEQQLRHFSALIKARLDGVPIPDAIANFTQKDSINKLDSSYFAQQLLALYDSYASQDIFKMQCASMEYGGWDSHKNLRTQIEPKLEDIFGTNKGLDTLIGEIQKLRNDSYDNSLFVIAGEFGRQLQSNGSAGNDHGRGNSVLVIGGKVNGGFYGDPFPDYEIENLNVKNKDIEGKTSMFRVFAEAVNWQNPGVAQSIFGDLSSHILEDGVDLSKMIEA